VFEATRLVAEAKLDLADRPEARITALEQTLEVAQFIEKHLQDQLDKGFGSRADLERARFGRLSVEVELLKAKQK
jgi:outer membrane protein TolC